MAELTPAIWFASIASVLIISLVSLVGIAYLGFTAKRLENVLIYLVSFAAGTMFGDVFLHLLPETVEEQGFTAAVSLSIFAGLLMFFVVEKFVHWRHCHLPITEDHVHPVAKMNLFGDIVHNLLDGVIVGASYLVSLPVGIATTIAVVIHEVPQEMADFGVLLHGGYTRMKALFFNFLTALAAVLGAVLALGASSLVEGLELFLVPFAVGGFLYVAGADLIPELHKETRIERSVMQFLAIVLGIAVMYGLTFLEFGH